MNRSETVIVIKCQYCGHRTITGLGSKRKKIWMKLPFGTTEAGLQKLRHQLEHMFQLLYMSCSCMIHNWHTHFTLLAILKARMVHYWTTSTPPIQSSFSSHRDTQPGSQYEFVFSLISPTWVIREHTHSTILTFYFIFLCFNLIPKCNIFWFEFVSVSAISDVAGHPYTNAHIYPNF